MHDFKPDILPAKGLIHLVGIGGAAQSALAEVLLDMHYNVTGSDLRLSSVTAALAQRGAVIQEGHSAENVRGAALVVTTVAAQADNVELVAAQHQNIPVLTVAEVVSPLCNLRRCLAIAGTHGKTTTTNMVAAMMMGVGLDPLYFIGGVSRDLGHAGYAGKGEFAVIEADEYAGRFLHLQPEAAIITNIEHDHPDIYPDMAAMKKAFQAFAGKIKPGGYLFLGGNDAAIKNNFAFSPVTLATYGLEQSNEWQAINVLPNDKGGHDFSFCRYAKELAKVSLVLPGLHNVMNATGALAMCVALAPQIEPQAFADVLGTLKGAQRRFEVKGEANGVLMVDDYAHHPTEVAATLAAARVRYPQRRIVALFQPHTYSRTKALLNEFAAAFEKADIAALLEIFAAREQNTENISSADLLAKMRHPGKVPQVLTMGNAASALQEILQPGDVLLTLGAGDVWKIGEQILSHYGDTETRS